MFQDKQCFWDQKSKNTTTTEQTSEIAGAAAGIESDHSLPWMKILVSSSYSGIETSKACLMQPFKANILTSSKYQVTIAIHIFMCTCTALNCTCTGIFEAIGLHAIVATVNVI